MLRGVITVKKNVQIIKGEGALSRKRFSEEISLKRVAAYCRVSTDEKDQINSYNSQVKHYTEFIQNNKDWHFAGVYADEAITGTAIEKRIYFQKLINDCINGDIDIVITKSISRFARNTLDTLKYVRELKEYNVAVYFEEENINTLTMDGELLLTILSSVAQQEVENTSAHVKKGLKMKMERGELVGFQGCLGYDYDKETKSILINEEEAEIVKYIFNRYLDGAGGAVISRELQEKGIKSPRGKDKWSETTILGIIKNEKYKGDILMGKTFTVDPISKRRLDNFGEQDKYYIENHHEPIISEEDFEKAQEIRLKRARNRNTVANADGKRQKYSRMYPFSSKLECAFCGDYLSRRTWHSKTDYNKVIWQCVRATKKGKRYCPHSKGIEELAIEKAFLESYRQVCKKDENITNDFLETIKDELANDNLQKDLNKTIRALDSIKREEKKLLDLHLKNLIDESVYSDKFKKLNLKKEKLMDEKRLLEMTIKDDNEVKTRLKRFKKIIQDNDLLTEFDGTIFDSIVEKVIVGGVNDNDEIDPYMLTFIYRTGESDIEDAKEHKSPRKNASQKKEKDSFPKLCSNTNDELQKMCSYTTDNACGVHSVDTKSKIVKILHFKQFYKHYVFNEDGDGGRKKS